jgi:hypothetical protein
MRKPALLAILVLGLIGPGMAQPVATAKKNGKWGFIDKSGAWFIPAKFDSVENFYHGYAKIFNDRKEGLIDLKGKVILKPKYDYVGHVQEGVADIYDGDLHLFFDVKSRSLRSPVSDFPNYPYTPSGLSASSAPISRSYTYDIKDKHPPDTMYAETKERRYSYRVISMQSVYIPGWFCTLWHFVTPSFGELGTRWPGGDTILLMQNSCASLLPDSLLWFCVGGKYGLSSPTGKILHEPEFTSAGYFNSGFAPVRKDGLWGMIDVTGRVAIPPLYEKVRGVKEGVVAARYKGLWGFLDTSGNWVIKPELEGTDGNFRNPWHGFDPAPQSWHDAIDN